MNGNSGERLTFSDILLRKGYSIEIPIIQRDYAQGRETADQVRRNFLLSLYDCLKNDKHLDLDFIYGSIINQKFVPLDGQQRLTTLFLLHWYVASKGGKSESFRKMMTSGNKCRFSYETRITSRDFCSALVANDVLVPSSPDHTLSNIIKDAGWFYLSWERDPTIKSMLTMLDAIHEMFAESSGYYEKLTSVDKPLVTFQFIELQNFGLSDSLYIKMNARGMELTAFEAFKAKLEQLLEAYDQAYGSKLKDEFALKIDTVWTDLFWAYRDRTTQLFDEKLMNFIRVLATNEYALRPNHVFENLRQLVWASRLNFDDFKRLNCLDENFIKSLIRTLDILAEPGLGGIKRYLPDTQLLNESDLFQKAIEKDVSYPERVQLWALYKYSSRYLVDQQFVEWIRVIRNLTENTRIDEIPDYVAAVESVSEILNYGTQIVPYIADSSHQIKGFLAIQVQEERVKALLIMKSEEWKQAITNIENHGYFKGQIGFILSFCGILEFFLENQNLNWSAQDDKVFLEKFLNYSEKAGSVFSSSGLNHYDDFLFERALLCKGAYTLVKGRNNSFLIDSDRDIGWKRLLRDDSKKRDYVKELFDSIGTSQIETDLQKIIDESNVTDWRRYFIEFPEMLRACGFNKFIRWEGINDILLMERTQTNGEHREYYSYALCVRLRKMGNFVVYISSYSVDDYAYISKINEYSIDITYNYSGQYVIGHGNSRTYCSSQDEVLEYLKNRSIV